MIQTRTNRDGGDDGLVQPGRKALRVRLTGLGLLVVLFGLLLWARFLLVTGHPRTALAEPEPGQTAAADSAN